jgi:hypothetical protein
MLGTARREPRTGGPFWALRDNPGDVSHESPCSADRGALPALGQQSGANRPNMKREIILGVLASLTECFAKKRSIRLHRMSLSVFSSKYAARPSAIFLLIPVDAEGWNNGPTLLC